MINHTHRAGRPREPHVTISQTWGDGYTQRCAASRDQMRSHIAWLREMTATPSREDPVIRCFGTPRDAAGRFTTV